jgi:hypothetical protein
MEKWPSVPAAFGWLSLDARGRWLIKGERITNPMLQRFIDRNYACDDAGRWYFQNGPQRVFVALAYAPWVVRVEADALVTHTGQVIDALDGAWLDEDGVVLLATNLGPATVDDRDVDVLSSRFVQAGGKPPEEELLADSVEAITAGRDCELYLPYRGRSVRIRPIRRSDVPTRFRFSSDPSPAFQEAAPDASAA